MENREAIEIIRGLLNFRWRHRGMDAYACASCGAWASQNLDPDSKNLGQIKLVEGDLHSRTCPFYLADKFIEEHDENTKLV